MMKLFTMTNMTKKELEEYFAQFELIPNDQPFYQPKSHVKVDWDRKYTPDWALPENRRITGIVRETED